MRKADLIPEVEKTGITKEQAELVVDSVIHTIKEALKTADKVRLEGFGTFEDSKTKGKMAFIASTVYRQL